MNVLDKILVRKRETVGSASEWKSLANDAPPTRGFHRALTASPHPVSLIAEVKKASPVKGVLRQNFDPGAIAKSYAEAGAECLSVLTDVEFFQGSTENLIVSREISGLPVLRKDFTVAEADVYEARAMGADAVLLIVYALSDSQLREYRELAESLGMDALVEAHTLEEAERALATGATLVGVNNRDLTTFKTTIDVAERTIPQIADRATVVSESALHSAEDVARVAEAGARAVLIGTAFSKSADVTAKVREVMGR